MLFTPSGKIPTLFLKLAAEGTGDFAVFNDSTGGFVPNQMTSLRKKLERGILIHLLSDDDFPRQRNPVRDNFFLPRGIGFFNISIATTGRRHLSRQIDLRLVILQIGDDTELQLASFNQTFPDIIGFFQVNRGNRHFDFVISERTNHDLFGSRWIHALYEFRDDIFGLRHRCIGIFRVSPGLQIQRADHVDPPAKVDAKLRRPFAPNHQQRNQRRNQHRRHAAFIFPHPHAGSYQFG